MIARTLRGRVFRLLDQFLLSRLPEAWQRRILTALLYVARFALPKLSWPESAEPLMVRRQLPKPARPYRTLPDWARDDMNELARLVDPMLSPAHFPASPSDSFVSPLHWTQAGHAYHRIRECLRGPGFDTVILVPWLTRGGADLGALHHARACSEAFGQRTLVIGTEGGDSPWASRLPASTRFVDIGCELASLSATHGEPELLLARILIQLAPARIHIINSRLAWRTICRHGLAIRQASRIYASLYCDERNEDGHRTGLAQEYLPDAARWLEAIITDNSISPKEWTETLGIDPRLFHVAHFPACDRDMPRPASTRPGKRILWASRLTRQKRPQLLASLAEEMTDFHWDIHGTVEKDQRETIKRLSRLDNVTLHGVYDDFMQLAANGNHQAFVYTTAWDGLPNVLLEAATAQLPIVAADIGGIRDLIPVELLLPPGSGVRDYAHAIRGLADQARHAVHLRAQQQRLATFTWDNFVSRLKAIPGYV